jgi:hypothetical protein
MLMCIVEKYIRYYNIGRYISKSRAIFNPREYREVPLASTENLHKIAN